MKIIAYIPKKKKSGNRAKRRSGGIVHTGATFLLALGIVYICTSPALEVIERADSLSEARMKYEVSGIEESLPTSLMPAVVRDPEVVKNTDQEKISAEVFAASMFTPLDGTITSGIGMRDDPFGSGEIEYHRGTDIMPTSDLAVRAADAGVVEFAGYDDSYGNYMIIDHGSGVRTLYAHCEYLYLKAGDPVTRGMLIAKAGDTGRATGVHLHFEILEG